MTLAKETELGPPIIAWLRAIDFDAYQEVPCRGGSCDIVATRGPVTLACELKRKMGLNVIVQAERWLGLAHLVYVAVPSSGGDFGIYRRICEWIGIGLLAVRDKETFGLPVSDDPVRQVLPAQLRRRVDDHLRRCLVEEQKTYLAAGSPNGAGFSPFVATARECRRIVTERPGITVRELIEGIRHHYRTPEQARSNLFSWIDQGSIAGVEMRREYTKPPYGGKTICRLYPTNGTTEAQAR
jgi:hypothetical protein